MNWGYKLLVLYVSFALMMLYMVFRANNTKFDLVSDKYYQDELNYQQLIDASKNNNGDMTSVFKKENDILSITIPTSLHNKYDSSVVLLYCPQNAKFDKQYTYRNSNEFIYTLEKQKLPLSNYQYKLFVYSKGKILFYQEQ
jgi:hypothetical protein